jgi:hypothetical protein
MAQLPPVNGELRHVEWEATGFAGVANSTTYLVFDPTDSLSVQHPSGGFGGIPCRVALVRRLERQWYSVLFYTDEVWGDCPRVAQAEADIRLPRIRIRAGEKSP